MGDDSGEKKPGTLNLVDMLLQQRAETEGEQSTSELDCKSPEREPLTFSDYAKILDSQRKATKDRSSSEDQAGPSGE